MRKNLFYIMFLTFVSNLLFASAEVRDISVVGNCYNPGQSLTVQFQVRHTDGTNCHSLFGDIVLSSDAVCLWNDPCLLGNSGAYPDLDGHDGDNLLGSSICDSNWHNVTKVVSTYLPSAPYTPSAGYTSLAVTKKMIVSGDGQEFTEDTVYSYPNPTSGKTTIRFPLKEQARVNIAIYDINGNAVWTQSVDGQYGLNKIVWEGVNDAGRNVASGVYLLSVTAVEKHITKKIAVVRK